MAGFKAALEAQQEAVRGPSCRVAALLADMDPEDADALRAALADGTRQATVIARALESVGHKAPANTLSRHRRGDCTCDRREA